jgi:hypothetical protein
MYQAGAEWVRAGIVVVAGNGGVDWAEGGAGTAHFQTDKVAEGIGGGGHGKGKLWVVDGFHGLRPCGNAGDPSEGRDTIAVGGAVEDSMRVSPTGKGQVCGCGKVSTVDVGC